jgi:hypothetical protein
MKTSLSNPRAWKLIVTIALLATFPLGAIFVAYVHNRFGAVVDIDWFLADMMVVSILFGAPLFGAWGQARVPGSPWFMSLLRLTSLLLFAPAALTLFHFSPLESWDFGGPLAIAFLLSACTSALYGFAYQLVSLSRKAAPYARRIVWLAALAAWLFPFVRFVVPQNVEGPLMVFRPISQALLGNASALPAMAILFCVTLLLREASRYLAARASFAKSQPIAQL